MLVDVGMPVIHRGEQQLWQQRTHKYTVIQQGL